MIRLMRNLYSVNIMLGEEMLQQSATKHIFAASVSITANKHGAQTIVLFVDFGNHYLEGGQITDKLVVFASSGQVNTDVI